MADAAALLPFHNRDPVHVAARQLVGSSGLDGIPVADGNERSLEIRPFVATRRGGGLARGGRRSSGCDFVNLMRSD